MTDREKHLIIGVLTRTYTCSLDSSKSLDEQCEDFVNLGKKVIDIIDKLNNEKEDNNIIEEIEFHENKIKDIRHEMYIQRVLSVIPQVNPLCIF